MALMDLRNNHTGKTGTNKNFGDQSNHITP